MIESSPPDCHVSDDEEITKQTNGISPIVLGESPSHIEEPVTLCHVESNVECEAPVVLDGTGEQDSINTSASASMNTAFCIDDEEPAGRVESITETDKISIRNDVEELYNQIAGETNDGLLTTDEEHNLHRTESKKGWLVQVESFTTPVVNAPEIKIVDINPQDNLEGIPEPKERKKKKKKKKSEKSDEGSTPHAQETLQNTVVPSDPLLLGFASQPDDVTQPSDKASEKTTRSKHDIPKQFLDASADLIDNSYSDASDIEDGEIGEDGKKKSTKRSKKEGCKSQ